MHPWTLASREGSAAHGPGAAALAPEQPHACHTRRAGADAGPGSPGANGHEARSALPLARRATALAGPATPRTLSFTRTVLAHGRWRQRHVGGYRPGRTHDRLAH